jgi:glycosyltransferase involved in cell wall biosynthesis
MQRAPSRAVAALKIVGSNFWISATDVFVLASQSENFGIAAAEALLASLLLLLSEGVALAQGVAAEGAAILPSSKYTAIAANLAFILDNLVMTSAIGVRAHAFPEGRFSVSAIAWSLKGLYVEIIDPCQSEPDVKFCDMVHIKG